MRPFFSYYGAKWRDALHYPKPLYPSIIEPFCGSAGYGVRHFAKTVVLADINPVLASVWRYLIGVSEQELLSLPDISAGTSIDDYSLPQEAKWLIGFWLNRAVQSPQKTPSAWMREGKWPGSFWGKGVRARLARQVSQIRHWQVLEVGFENFPCPSKPATWFVDPPYQGVGNRYVFGSPKIDFAVLSEWCQSLPGQVIVCENEGANWLPFSRPRAIHSTRIGPRKREVFWTNYSTEKQLNFFSP